MRDIQTVFGQPGVGLLAMLLIGAIAGWIAEQITKSDHGIFTNILVGIAGAFVGGRILSRAARAWLVGLLPAALLAAPRAIAVFLPLRV